MPPPAPASSSPSRALRLPVLPLDGKVLFPRTYLRLTVSSPAALQLLKDLVWDVQAAPPARASRGNSSHGGSSSSHASASTGAATLSLAVFTQRPPREHADAEAEAEADVNKEDDVALPALHEVGTLAKIVQLTRVQGSTGLTILVQGVARIRVRELVQTRPYAVATVDRVADVLGEEPTGRHIRDGSDSLDALAARLKRLTHEFMELSKGGAAVLRKTAGVIGAIGSASVGELADVVVSYTDADAERKQRVLDAARVRERVALAMELLEHEIERAQLQKKIASEVQGKLEGSRREFLLRQQLEAIKKELGEADEDAKDGANDVKLLEERIQALHLDAKAAKVAQRELRRLKNMPSSQPEYSILHNYLEFFAELPWNKQTEDSLTVRAVREQLDADHYGLDKVKRRITEYIAVRSLKQDMKGPILCLVGPPGVGKTSLGKSIALATQRKFERVALGGVHDESEIRGHRKTYIGAMPGCILNALRHADSRNPVVLLDEVDKLGKDFRGDPASALLEVLDPHQNNTFSDHYLNVPFDLSNVMFIATANSLETIPGPLLDRMEVIDVSGYSVEQKMEIAKRYLLPRQIEENGLQQDAVRVTDDALRFLIMSYTREAGVRNLERQIAAICRHVAVSVVNARDKGNEKAAGSSKTPTTKFTKTTRIDRQLIQQILGHEMVLNEVALRSSVPGVATGMSWSTTGGSILFVEASCTRVASTAQLLAASSSATSLPRLHLTGKLGDVMKESAQLALSWLRANIHHIDAPAQKHSSGGRASQISLDGISDVHVHFPEGAISKDGPSAGGAIVCAMLSVVSGVPVPADVAMTGEITLRGVILPVGGIREKVLAAIRAGIKRVILPKGNQHEADELQREFALAGPKTSSSSKRKTASSASDVQLLFVNDLKELVHLVFGMKVHDDSGMHGLDPFSRSGQSTREDTLHFSKL